MATTETGRVKSLTTTGVVVCAAVFPVLSAVSVVLRYVARRRSTGKLQADDYWCFVTWIVAFGLSINAWVFASIMGIDYYRVTPSANDGSASQCLAIAGLILQVALTTVKISILLLYKRIFSTRKFQIACWIAIVIISIWGILFFFLVIFQAVPFSMIWTGRGRFVISATKLGPAQAGTSLALDIVVLIFPIPVLARLHMPTIRKVAIGFILWLGAFCVVAAICRLVFLDESLAAVLRARVSGGIDLHSIFARAYIFMIIEPNCSIIAASLPCLGPLFSATNRPGRALESVIRSARSAISVLSRSSGSAASSPRGSARNTDVENPKAPASGEQTRVNSETEPAITSKTGISVVNAEARSEGSRSEEIELREWDAQGKGDEDRLAVTETYDVREARR